MMYLWLICKNNVFAGFDFKIFVQGYFNSLAQPANVNNSYSLWFSNIELEPRKIAKSLAATFVVVTLLQILYNSIPEIAFLNFMLHLFWLFLNLINIVYKIFIPFCVVWFSSSIIVYNNPIHSLLALIFVFFNMVVILISLKIEFLAMIFLIIYIGAISILFLFVIMLFNLKSIYNLKMLQTYHFVSAVIALCCFFKFYFLLANSFQISFNHSYNSESSQFIYLKSLINTLIYFEDIISIGTYLYTSTSEIFLALGYILLIAMVGAIIMALSTIKQTQIIRAKLSPLHA